MYDGLKHAHSGLRYLVLALLLLAIFRGLAGWFGKKPFSEGDRKIFIFSLASVHVQFILGLILYFISPLVNFSNLSDKITRFYTVEHISMMTLAVILITVGYSTGKRGKTDLVKFKNTTVLYIIGLLMILSSIPWSFLYPNAHWF
jgi:hypothetical protein